jgi:hypothetical protein
MRAMVQTICRYVTATRPTNCGHSKRSALQKVDHRYGDPLPATDVHNSGKSIITLPTIAAFEV